MAASIVTLDDTLIHSLAMTAEQAEAAGLPKGSHLRVSLLDGRILLEPLSVEDKLAMVDALYGSFHSDVDLVAELQSERRQDKW